MQRFHVGERSTKDGSERPHLQNRGQIAVTAGCAKAHTGGITSHQACRQGLKSRLVGSHTQHRNNGHLPCLCDTRCCSHNLPPERGRCRHCPTYCLKRTVVCLVSLVSAAQRSRAWPNAEWHPQSPWHDVWCLCFTVSTLSSEP